MNALFDVHAARRKVFEPSENPWAGGVAFIDGAYAPRARARPPVLDQGAPHSDLSYEPPAVRDGRCPRLGDRLVRQEASSAKLREKHPLDRWALRETPKIAEATGRKTVVGHAPLEAGHHGDELSFATTTGGVMPVIELDGRPVGGGQAGATSRAIWEADGAARNGSELSFEIKYD